MDNKDIKEVQEAVSRFLNRYDSSGKMGAFLDEFENDHRTLQQLFTRLCLMWIERVARDEYGTDGRNEASQRVARELLEGWVEKNGDLNPSDFLPFI